MDYRQRLHRAIPGGAHTYSRGDDQYPENAPPILSHGKGAYVWDADGRRYLDYGMALRAVTVGYAHEGIAAAAQAEIAKGNQLTRPSLTELQAAELLIDLIPGADMVKFGKNGSTVTTAAVKMARAFNGRKYVAVCADHPFFSYDDWFIGVTPIQRGIPEESASLTLKFHYGDISSLQALFDQYPDQISCVMLEPATTVAPCPGGCTRMSNQTPCALCPDNHSIYLHKVKELCHKKGALFILDEMITGFRWHQKGAQFYYGVEPDLATFGKGMANGFSVAALVGKREVMNLGGIDDQGAERVFLISTTHGAEMCGLGAFIKTVEVYRESDVVGSLWKYGVRLLSGMTSIATDLGIQDYFQVEGYPCSPSYVTKDKDGVVSLPLRTLFNQEMIRNGVLIPWIALSASHGETELSFTMEAVRKSLAVYAQALDKGTAAYLKGSVIKPVFRRRN